MKAAVDRIEGDTVIFVVSDENGIKFSLPRDLLPEVAEGDIVEIEVRKDVSGTQNERRETKKRVDALKKASRS